MSQSAHAKQTHQHIKIVPYLNPMPLTQSTQPHTINRLAAAALRTGRFLQTNGESTAPVRPKQPHWHTGLCSCSAEPGGCEFFTLACCCPCVAYGMNYSLLVTGSPCNIDACWRPCCLFAALEAAELAAEYEHAHRGHWADTTQIFMVANHQLAVGQRIGLYRSPDCGTVCSIYWETACCTPCAQTRIRNEVAHQRSAGNPFRFRPQINTCGCCAVCCCAKDCGCAGCVEAA